MAVGEDTTDFIGKQSKDYLLQNWCGGSYLRS